MDIGTKCACILTLATFISTRGDEANDCYLPPFVCTMIPKDELLWAYPEWQIVGSYRDMLFAYDLAVEIANKIQGGGHSDSTGLVHPNVTTWKGWVEFNQLKILKTSVFEDSQDSEAQASIKSPPVWLIIAKRTDYNYFLKSVISLPDSLILLVCKSSISFPGEFKNSGNGLLEKRLKPDLSPFGGKSYKNYVNRMFQTVMSKEIFEEEPLLQKGAYKDNNNFKYESKFRKEDPAGNRLRQIIRPDVVHEGSELPTQEKSHYFDKSSLKRNRFIPLKNLELIERRLKSEQKATPSLLIKWMKNGRVAAPEKQSMLNAVQRKQFHQDDQNSAPNPLQLEDYLGERDLLGSMGVDSEDENFGDVNEEKSKTSEDDLTINSNDENYDMLVPQSKPESKPESDPLQLKDYLVEEDLLGSMGVDPEDEHFGDFNEDKTKGSIDDPTSIESSNHNYDALLPQSEETTSEANPEGSLKEREALMRSLASESDNDSNSGECVSHLDDTSLKDGLMCIADENSPSADPSSSAEGDLVAPAKHGLDVDVNNLNTSLTSDKFRYSLLPLLRAADGFDEAVEQFVAKLQVNKAKQKEIFDATIEGHDSERWHEERKFRLTASGFGAVYNWSGTTERLIHWILYSIPQNTTVKRKALKWGQKQERRAAEDYAQRHNVKVDRSGLIVDLERGFLAASPDGLIGNDTLLEIKCPFFLRNANLSAIIKENALYCCTLDKEKNQVRLNRDHFHYYQVQGQLGISGRKKGVFILWTPRGFLSETIDFDPELWKDMTVKLEKFYKTHIVPEFIYNYHQFKEINSKRRLLGDGCTSIHGSESSVVVEGDIAPPDEYNFDEDVSNGNKSWSSHKFKYSLMPMLGAAAGLDVLVEHFVAKLKVDKIKQKEIFDATIEQHDSKRWFEERKFRLTASRFGFVYNWTGTMERLLHRLLYSIPKNTTGKQAALNWGQEHERRATDDYARLYNVKVDRSGLIVDLERGFLGASPDGLIGSDTLLEVKCPYFLRNTSLTDIIKEKDLYCCTLDKEKNQVRLNPDHIYYYQVQGQLGISGRKKGIFVLWTPQGFLTETINFDPELWRKMTVKLEEFYKTHMVPEFVYNYERFE